MSAAEMESMRWPMAPRARLSSISLAMRAVPARAGGKAATAAPQANRPSRSRRLVDSRMAPVCHKSARGLPPARAGSIAHHHQPVGAGLRRPDLAGAAVELAHVGAAPVAGEALECLRRRIEAHDGIVGPVGEPDLVLVVDIDGVAARAGIGDRPDLPLLLERIVAADLAAVPEAHPQQPLGVRPYAARPDAGFGRRHHE